MNCIVPIMDAAYPVLLGFLGGYAALWMACQFSAHEAVKKWAIEQSLSRVKAFLPRRTPDLGRTRRRRFHHLTARDSEGKVREIWIAVSPSFLGLVFADRIEPMNLRDEEENESRADRV